MDETRVVSSKRIEFKARPDSEQYQRQPSALSCNCWRQLLSVLCFVSLSLALVGPAFALSLDAEIDRLLTTGTDKCQGFVDAGGDPNDLPAICGPSAPGGPATSAGGGASTPQNAPGIVQERLDALRGEESGSASGSVSELAPRLSLLLSAEYEGLDRDRTDFEDGYDSDIKRFTLGADYQFSDTFMAGLALTYYKHDGDFDSGGDFDNDSYGLLAFLSVIPHEQAFVQATVGFATKGYDRTRQAELVIDATQVAFGPAKGDYDGKEYSGGIQAGYDQQIGSITIGPRLGLDWTYSNFDGYSEQGNTGLELAFEDTDEFSFQSRLGLMGSVAVSTGFGVLLPQLNVDWVHEFENDQRTENFSFVDDSAQINFQFEDESPDRDYFEVAVGVSAVLPHGWQLFAQYRTILGHDYIDSHVGALGMRFDF